MNTALSHLTVLDLSRILAGPWAGQTLADLGADVVLEKFKVGGLKAYGLDYESLRSVNPELINCSITGFGQTGPYAQRAAAPGSANPRDSRGTSRNVRVRHRETSHSRGHLSRDRHVQTLLQSWRVEGGGDAKSGIKWIRRLSGLSSHARRHSCR